MAKTRYKIEPRCSCAAFTGSYFITDSEAPDKTRTVMCKVYDYKAAEAIVEALNRP